MNVMPRLKTTGLENNAIVHSMLIFWEPSCAGCPLSQLLSHFCYHSPSQKKNRTWEYTPFQAWCTSPLLNNLISLLFISVSLIIHTRKTASWESLADSQSLCNRDEPLSTGFLFPSQSSIATILPC